MITKRSATFVSILSALMSLATCAAAQAKVEDRIDEYVRVEMARQKIPGLSLAVIRDGKPLIVKGYGLANVEHNVAVKPETIFQSGSMGKQFTAAALMLLVEEGKIGLDDNIAKYVGSVPDAWKAITIRNVLNHTAGMPNDFSDDDYKRNWTEDQLLEKAKAMPLVFAPGSDWAYSNVGYVVLGIIVSKVSGKFYGDLLQERIFKPLGMTTARIISEADIIPNRAAGYRLVKGELKNQEWVSPTMNTTADGSIYWSILDLVKWDAALAKGEVLKHESWRESYTPAKFSNGNTYPYGFGWGLSLVNGHSIIEHSGGWQGFSTDIARYPDDKVSVIILTNLANASPGTMARAIAEILVPDLIERPIIDKEPATTLAHRQLLESIIANHIDHQAFSPKAQKDLVPLLEAAADRNKALGAIEAFEPLTRVREGNKIRHRYLIKFKDKTAIISILLDADGKVDQMRIQVRP